MENDKGELVDLYVPAMQISVGKVDETGRYTGENITYALCGFVRSMGESDDSLNRLAQRDGLLKNVWSAGAPALEWRGALGLEREKMG
ncbi:uncharacterized protein H6S33_009828 [Morchella sextelata]|uniref:uncharacterized protein n=1 Tax=Morchella sextelata TaxID=1174677 RepID=UPI001D0563AF|nr:uncharacterized protein H6S33_009828 [Morchella sextelata]KAH0602310.1 hypothetical protein H6S33_009828 [Morchella sextelata]